MNHTPLDKWQSTRGQDFGSYWKTYQAVSKAKYGQSYGNYKVKNANATPSAPQSWSGNRRQDDQQQQPEAQTPAPNPVQTVISDLDPADQCPNVRSFSSVVF